MLFYDKENIYYFDKIKKISEKRERRKLMKKKIVSVLLVAAMAVSMFTGCGSKIDSKKSDS